MESLTEQEYKYVLGVLSQRPYNEVFVIMNKLLNAVENKKSSNEEQRDDSEHLVKA